MAYEIGTDSYANYVRKVTPNQKGVKQNKENKKSEVQELSKKTLGSYVSKASDSKRQKSRSLKKQDKSVGGIKKASARLDEKAVSQQQQKLMGLAYAVKKGDITAPSAEIQKIADSMSLKELKKMAKGKHDNLPVKKEDVVVPEEIADEDAAEFITKAAAAKKAGKKSFTLGGKTYPVTIKTDVPTEANEAVALDGRTKLFKEKLKKLAYEKAKRMAREQKKKEKAEETKAKVTINPIKEERRGYNLVKKYKKLQEEKTINSLEEEILNYIQEGAFKAMPPSVPEHGESSDIPPSAMSIARAFKVSPIEVQAVLDKMVSMGTITRVGDAYSYGSTS